MNADRQKSICILSWFVMPALLFLPFLWIDTDRFFSNDTLTYSVFLTLTEESLKAGDWFMRWFPSANGGLGNPAMLLNVPLAYIVTAIVNAPFGWNTNIGLQLALGLYASQVASCASAFMWLKRHFPSAIAWAGSLIFVLLPYKLVYLYLNGNLAQLWALALLPLWMIAAEKLAGEQVVSENISCYALTFAAVYYTHPLTVIAFAAVPAGYVICFGNRRGPIINIGVLFLAHMGGLLLCLMHLIPQRLYLQSTRSELFFGRYRWQDNLFHVDVMLCAYYGVIAGMIAYGVVASPGIRKSVAGQLALFWVLVIVVAAFLTQRPSAFIWEYMPLLHYLQFPAARLHAAALMAVSYLLCMWMQHSQALKVKAPLLYSHATPVALVALFAAITIHHLATIYHEKNAVDEGALVRDVRARRIIAAPEYETRWGCLEADRALEEYRAGVAIPLIAASDGNVDIRRVQWSPPTDMAFSVTVTSPEAAIVVRQCYFPGWQVRDDNDRSIEIHPEKTRGLLAFRLPRGVHEIRISFPAGPLEIVGRAVSAAMLLFCLAVIFGRRVWQFLTPGKVMHVYGT